MTNVVPFRRRAASDDPSVDAVLADRRPIGLAKEGAYQGEPPKPRQPVRLTAEQLAETYRRSGLRDPRQRARPTLEVVA